MEHFIQYVKEYMLQFRINFSAKLLYKSLGKFCMLVCFYE